MKVRRLLSSRQRYRAFVDDFRSGRLDDPAGESPRRQAQRGRLRAYAQRLRPFRGLAALTFLCAALVAAIETSQPLFMRFIVDRVLLNGDLDASTRITRLNLVGAGFLAVTALASALGAARNYVQRVLNLRLMLSLRRSLFDRLVHLPLARLSEMKTGGVLSRLTGDIDTTAGLLPTAVVAPVVAAIRLAVVITILLILSWRLALVAMTLIPVISVMSFTVSRRVRPIYRSVRRETERIDGRVGETVAGIRIVRAFRREKRELLGYLRGRHSVMRQELFAYRRELTLWTSWGLLLAIGNTGIIWYGGYLQMQGGTTSIGDLMAFQLYAFLLASPASTIVTSFSELQRSLAAMDRVFDILATPADKPDREDARPAPARVDEIRFEHVGFEYWPAVPVVRGFDLTVTRGSVVALVGRSGAGKTTITDLVARFHDPTAGRILLNGVDLRDIRLCSYRRLLGIVQQDVFLFDGSVQDNIAYGRPDASSAEIEEAARRANAHEFVVRLPEGYDTFVGERGVQLSLGQRQRLAIARAILAAPQILILDEATSNLDSESERLVQGAIASLLAGRTTFVIAHRLSTVREADVILVIEDGCIIESGTHEQLMLLDGAYCRMVRSQMTFDHSLAS